MARIDHLLGRYGGQVDDLLALVASRRQLALPLEGAEDHLAAEVVYAVTHEGALHLDDVLTRRTRISIETFDRGVRAAPHAARLMAEVLGWDEARVAPSRDSRRETRNRRVGGHQRTPRTSSKFRDAH